MRTWSCPASSAPTGPPKGIVSNPDPSLFRSAIALDDAIQWKQDREHPALRKREGSGFETTRKKKERKTERGGGGRGVGIFVYAAVQWSTY